MHLLIRVNSQSIVIFTIINISECVNLCAVTVGGATGVVSFAVAFIMLLASTPGGAANPSNWLPSILIAVIYVPVMAGAITLAAGEMFAVRQILSNNGVD